MVIQGDANGLQALVYALIRLLQSRQVAVSVHCGIPNVYVGHKVFVALGLLQVDVEVLLGGLNYTFPVSLDATFDVFEHCFNDSIVKVVNMSLDESKYASSCERLNFDYGANRVRSIVRLCGLVVRVNMIPRELARKHHIKLG